jgi:putative transposase
MVEELKIEQQAIFRCCLVLEVSRSGYYAWLCRPESERQLANEILTERIVQIWKDSRGIYGLPRICEKLKNLNVTASKNRVQKLMRKSRIQGVGNRKFKVKTTDSNHDLPIASRVFKTEEHADLVVRPNQFWGGDITYIPTNEGWLYLSVFLDLFTRKIVGHSMSETMTSELVIDSLDMYLKRQGLAAVDNLTAHTDRGSQYAAEVYRDKLGTHGIAASMSRKGNCYDNAFVESFFRTLKVELVYRTKFKSRNEAKVAIFEFIEVWDNRQRIHSSLGYLTPMQYEEKQLAA